jgi:hypothetical protein
MTGNSHRFYINMSYHNPIEPTVRIKIRGRPTEQVIFDVKFRFSPMIVIIISIVIIVIDIML